MLRILIADDHTLIREGLKKILKNETAMQVTAEAATANEIFRHLSRGKIDLVILDITLPGRNGLEILKEIKKYYRKIPVLILTMHSEERYAIRCLKAGASGYITKQSAADELISALVKIYNGKKHITPEIAEKLANEIEVDRDKEYHEILSNREFQIMTKIAAGGNMQEIAKELSLSISTVNTYRYRILEKMNMRNNTDMIRYALEHNLID